MLGHWRHSLGFALVTPGDFGDDHWDIITSFYTEIIFFAIFRNYFVNLRMVSVLSEQTED